MALAEVAETFDDDIIKLSTEKANDQGKNNTKKIQIAIDLYDDFIKLSEKVTTSQPKPKKKIWLDSFACQELAESTEGAKALTHPNLILKTSHNSNYRFNPYNVSNNRNKRNKHRLSFTFENSQTSHSQNTMDNQFCYNSEKNIFIVNNCNSAVDFSQNNFNNNYNSSNSNLEIEQFNLIKGNNKDFLKTNNIKSYNQSKAYGQSRDSQSEEVCFSRRDFQNDHLNNISDSLQLKQSENFSVEPKNQYCYHPEIISASQLIKNSHSFHNSLKVADLNKSPASNNLLDVELMHNFKQNKNYSMQMVVDHMNFSSTSQNQHNIGQNFKKKLFSQNSSQQHPTYIHQSHCINHQISLMKSSPDYSYLNLLPHINFDQRHSSLLPTIPKFGYYNGKRILLKTINNRPFIKKKKIGIQSNSLLNYFEVSPKKKPPEVNNDANSTQTIQQNQDFEKNEANCMENEICRKETHFDLISKNNSSTSSDNEIFDKYGLLGTGADLEEETDPDYFRMLPLEIHQNIFCRLPVLDLYLTINRVCRYWNEVISDVNFITWKKNYYKLRKKIQEIEINISREMMSNSMMVPSGFLPQLIRYMNKNSQCCSKNILYSFQKHSKYSVVMDFSKENVQDCLINEELSLWSLVTGLIVFSDSVLEIRNIISILFNSSYNLDIIQVFNKLYCIMSLLWAYRIKFNCYSRIHYQLYYCLYHLENPLVSSHVEDLSELHNIKKSGQQSILKFTYGNIYLTQEQMRIVNHCLQLTDVVRIQALAGSGKTTTLVEFTKMRPMMKFLLIVYNKSVQIHAQKLFPCNVTCKTAHSLAYGEVGRKYKDKLTLKLRMMDISFHLESSEENNSISHRYTRAKIVLQTIESFVSSSDLFITSAHVPTTIHKNGKLITLTWNECMQCLQESERIWKKLQDVSDKTIKITHDIYMKFYHLSQPSFFGYDCILVDEAQDCNPAILNIILSQNVPVVLIGDPHQQIYSFRGAVNALASIQSTHTYQLTQSFRFGPEIALIANSCLEVMKRVRRTTLVGTAPTVTRHSSKSQQLAIIVRTNVTLFSEAVRLCCLQPDDSLMRTGCVGGIRSLDLDKIYDIYTLLLKSNSQKDLNFTIKDKFINRFSNFSNLKTYANHAEDTDLLGKIKIVLMYNHNIPLYVELLKKRCNCPIELADVVLTTAHKSKGLEFDTVRLSDDFPINNIPMDGTHDDEINVLYVAITRAKKTLEKSRTLAYIQDLFKITEEKPDSS